LTSTGFPISVNVKRIRLGDAVMTLQPWLAAPVAVQLHSLAALAALVLGAVQLLGRKGAQAHRAMGWAWVGAMLLVALSSFAITGLRGPAQLSLIHALSAAVLVLAPLAALHARRGRLRHHQIMMPAIFLGALVITGAFTLMPGRLMARVVFG
jgi:uncharacterized membrane protein